MYFAFFGLIPLAVIVQNLMGGESVVLIALIAYCLGYGYGSNYYKLKYDHFVYDDAIREAKKE